MRVFKIVSSIVLGVIAGFVVFYLFLTPEGDSAIVPQVLGENCDSAIGELERLGFRVERVGDGRVTGLSVKNGMEVRHGRKIRVVCGETSSVDPCSVKGASLEFAREFMETLGLKLEVSKMKYSGNVGQVLDCRVWKGKVWLLVDSGKKDLYRPVPNLVGLERGEAEEVLREMGLEYDTTGSGDTIVRQFPEPGSFATEVILETE